MKRLLTLILVMGMAITAYSQTSEKPWAAGLGLHWASFGSVDKPLKNQFKDMDFMGGPIEASLSRYISKYANIQLTAGILSLKEGKKDNYNISSKNYWYFDVDAQIKFLGGVIEEDARVTPYFYFGLGQQRLNKENDLKTQLGLGVDVNVVKSLAFYARMDYVVPSDGNGYTYYHPHVGLKYRFNCSKNKDKDSDGDGIPDKNDKCPTVKGTAENQGCPEITQAEKDQIQLIARAIYFDSGKDVIKAESQAKLDELLPILSKYPALKIRIEGHTDNVGDDANNLKLSQARVDAVKKYLVNKGVASGRMTAIGYGETKPIADNNTEEGKAKNRRVELTTMY